MLPILADGLDYFFPRWCPFCVGGEAETDRGVCADCDARLVWFEPPWCDGCGRPLDAGGRTTTHCRDCMTMPLPLRHAYSAIAYDKIVQTAIARLKYGGEVSLGPALAAVLKHLVPGWVNIFHYDLIVPVPTTPRRLRERGYNQALLIARRLAQRFRMPIAARNLVRTRDTPAQASLDRKERLANLGSAFSLRRPQAMQGKRVLLVDDVMTTGMTLAASATTLLEAGATWVDALTLARTLPGRPP